MANLTITIDTGDNNVIAESKVLSLPLRQSITTINISPVFGYKINSEDFTVNILPEQIDNVEFNNLGEKVVARIAFKNNISSNIDQNINIRVYGKTNPNISTFKLSDNTKNKVGWVETTHSKFVKTDENIYNIAVVSNEKILVLTKRVTCVKDYYFTKEPSLVLDNRTAYTVDENTRKDINGNIVSKTFNIYYNPTRVSEHVDGSIEILASSKKVLSTAPIIDDLVDKKEDYKIYSFNTGRDFDDQGGVKKMPIRGVPGTKFKLILQDGDKKTYNFKTGVFENGGGALEGKIPPPSQNKLYGEYIAYANIPKATSQNTSIQTILAVDKPVDHKKLVDKIRDHKTFVSNPLAEVGISTSKTQQIYKTSSVTFTIIYTGNIQHKSTVYSNVVGPGRHGTSSDDINTIEIEFGGKDITTHGLNISRQPVDSDFTLTTGDAKYNVSATAETIGEPVGSNNATNVLVKITTSNVIFGTTDSTVRLNIDNFLTAVTL